MLCINGLMLHPDDEKWRMEYIFKALFCYIAEQNTFWLDQQLAKKTVHAGIAVLLAESVSLLGRWTKFYEFTLSYRKESFQQDFLERFSKGLAAGMLSHHAVAERVSLSTAIKKMIEDNQNFDSTKDEDKLQVPDININFTESNLSQNIWPKYKRVAHLWASLNNFMQPEGLSSLASSVFVNIASLKPQNPGIKQGGFDGFYYIANEYRAMGIWQMAI